MWVSGRVSLLQEPTDTSKQPIRTRQLGHLTGYQPIRDQYFLGIAYQNYSYSMTQSSTTERERVVVGWRERDSNSRIVCLGRRPVYLGYWPHSNYHPCWKEGVLVGKIGQYQEPTETSKQPIRTRCLGHVTAYQPVFPDSVGSRIELARLFGTSTEIDTFSSTSIRTVKLESGNTLENLMRREYIVIRIHLIGIMIECRETFSLIIYRPKPIITRYSGHVSRNWLSANQEPVFRSVPVIYRVMAPGDGLLISSAENTGQDISDSARMTFWPHGCLREIDVAHDCARSGGRTLVLHSKSTVDSISKFRFR
eukprot:sb/3467135/